MLVCCGLVIYLLCFISHDIFVNQLYEWSKIIKNLTSYIYFIGKILRTKNIFLPLFTRLVIIFISATLSDDKMSEESYIFYNILYYIR